MGQAPCALAFDGDYLWVSDTVLRCFNPRPHAGGDAGDRGHRRPADLGFNPRPHAGGDSITAEGWQEIYVSIHAPAWGATW